MSHDEPGTKPSYSPLYWLFHRDPYFMVYERILYIHIHTWLVIISSPKKDTYKQPQLFVRSFVPPTAGCVFLLPFSTFALCPEKMRFETLDLFSGRSCDEEGPTFDLRVALSAEIPVKEMPRWVSWCMHGTGSTKVYIPYKFTIKIVKNQAIPVLWMVWDWEPKIKGKQKMKSKWCGWLWLCTVFFVVKVAGFLFLDLVCLFGVILFQHRESHCCIAGWFAWLFR